MHVYQCLQGLEDDYAELAERLAGSHVTVAKFQVRCAALRCAALCSGVLGWAVACVLAALCCVVQ